MALGKERARIPGTQDLAIVIGAGRSGLGAAKLLANKKVRTRLLERDSKVLSEEEKKELQSKGIELVFGEHLPEHFADASFIIPSPGMPLTKLEELLPHSAVRPEIISELELAYRYLNDEPILAVTGTSGKTTTASLAAAMLKMQGYTVFLGGNIGTPLSEYILDGRKADVLVLECSSFQLQGCTTFCPRVAVLLNISPNHLDHHKDMAEYADSKFRIFRCQEKGDLAILGPGMESISENFAIPARKLFLSSPASFSDMRLLGAHNRLNAEAAWQAARFFGVSLANAQKSVAAFSPLPHRLENVGTYDGITYINDSKCTTVAALKVALEAFDRPVRLLAGGKFKGGDLSQLIPLLREKVSQVALFGGSREYFESAWTGVVPISWHNTLKEAVARLRGSSSAGDIILLAPATSSYDQYHNYMERGDDFRQIARGLK